MSDENLRNRISDVRVQYYWSGERHLERMGEARNAKRRPNGSRPFGCPRYHWSDEVQKDLDLGTREWQELRTGERGGI